MSRNQSVVISTEYIKLDSFLKLCGVCGTGGEAKQMILDGAVAVDGEVCTTRGKKLRPGAVVDVGGEKYEVAEGEG